MNPWTALAILPLAGYLVGSIPFGVILAKARGVDLRKSGSGNVGATNVGRVLGRPWGYLCFVLDTLKGFVPAMAAVLLVGPRDGQPLAPLHQAVWLGAALGAVMGHVLSFWLRFHGGKGVATSLGVVLGIFPYFTYAGMAAFGLWIVVTLISRYVSVGSIAAAVAFLGFFAAFNGSRLAELWPLEIFAAAVTALILVRHRGNIRRLLAGTENRIGHKSSAPK